jgi:NADH:ubiquinone oxidoreductase subunit 6 (subunit J)
MLDALQRYVANISGILGVCGAAVVIATVIIMTEVSRKSHNHINSAEITWAGFLSGVVAAGLISVLYGIYLTKKVAPSMPENRNNLQATIAFIFGVFLMAISIAGFFVPAASGS